MSSCWLAKMVHIGVVVWWVLLLVSAGAAAVTTTTTLLPLYLSTATYYLCLSGQATCAQQVCAGVLKSTAFLSAFPQSLLCVGSPGFLLYRYLLRLLSPSLTRSSRHTHTQQPHKPDHGLRMVEGGEWCIGIVCESLWKLESNGS